MLSLVFTLLVACEQKPPPIPGELERTGAVLATVNGVNVTQGMMDATLGGLPPNIREKVKAQGQEAQFKEKLVIGELLYQEALKQKLYEKPEIQMQLALAQRDAMAQAIMDKVINERTTDEALKKWYDEHKVQFARPQAKARHILVKDKAEADAIFAQVKADNGATFAQIAAAKSTDPGSAKEGGSLGWFEKGRMVPEFAEAVFAGNKGDIVGPIQTKFGFHVIQIEDKRDEIPLDEAKDKIKEKLRSEVIEAYIEELKKAATITDAAGGGAAVAPAAETDKKPGAAPSAPPAGAPPAPAAGK
jgi:peptidyl-prolyl cis-trans isomerase C